MITTIKIFTMETKKKVSPNNAGSKRLKKLLFEKVKTRLPIYLPIVDVQ